ncbi:hypothetical protein B0H14DRAFT_3492167 [Mycena olivaceomarginata]|nr:hypothetical protein B0H14DRAFT_3492167 [Mycena olivaceomarginata]
MDKVSGLTGCSQIVFSLTLGPFLLLLLYLMFHGTPPALAWVYCLYIRSFIVVVPVCAPLLSR